MKAANRREIRRASRPNALPTAANFTLARVRPERLPAHDLLVRKLFMSVAPYMRGHMNEERSCVQPFELDKPLNVGAMGEVIESLAKEFKLGDAVTSDFGWRGYDIDSPKELRPISREIQQLSVDLSAFGMAGMTAWAGLNLVEVEAGDSIYISEAAGAFGHVAGQLAELREQRAIGSAGSAEKVECRWAENGLDVAFNHKTSSVLEQPPSPLSEDGVKPAGTLRRLSEAGIDSEAVPRQIEDQVVQDVVNAFGVLMSTAKEKQSQTLSRPQAKFTGA